MQWFSNLRGGFRIPEPAIRYSFFSGIGSADRKRGKTKREEGRLIAAVSFWILDSLLVELEFRIPSAESLIPSSRIPDSIIKNFPNFGIRIALPLFILFPS